MQGTVPNHGSAGISVNDSQVRPNWYFWLLVCAWTFAVSGSLVWNQVQHAEEVRDQTVQAARALLEKDLFYRESILADGVYVTVSGQTSSNSISTSDERVIVTPSGRTLTLLNPAIVSRQVFGRQDQLMGIRGHLTSLKPIRPNNRPDAWEQQALQSFERGLTETNSIVTREDGRYFRMMRPLFTQRDCLLCHEEAGQKVGAVRGGISVTVPVNETAVRAESQRLTLAHTGLWLLGMTGLAFGARDFRQHNEARRRAEAERERLIAELREALANVKTLSGLLPICASCKKIRDDRGYWTQIESYLKEHSDARFTHGFCPDCVKKLYPEIHAEMEARNAQPDPASGMPGAKPPS